MVKKTRSKHAVSEVIGVVLLLGMTISLFAVLNFFVSSSLPFNHSVPLVSLTGSIDKEHQVITIENNAGESLGGATDIVITIGSVTNQIVVSDIVNSTDPVWKLVTSDTDKNPYQWDFGETVQFDYTGVDITGEFVHVTVVDTVKNTILLSAVLQQGSG